MKSLTRFCLILSVVVATVVERSYGQAESYFPLPIAYSWTYETEITGAPAFAETDVFVDTPFVDGRKAYAVEPSAGGGTGVAQTLYAFSGTDASMRYSVLPAPFDTMIGVLPSQWYTMFRFVSPATAAWTVFRYDTLMNVSGLPVPVRILITGKVKSSSVEVTVPAGTFTTAHIDITSQVGTYLGPIFIPFVTIVDSFWIAPSTWIVKEARDPVDFTFDTLSFTIPGLKRTLLASGPGTSVDEGSGDVSGFRLWQNFPNPFNPSTTFSYDIEQAGMVRLRVFDLSGRLVATLVDGKVEAGAHRVTWNPGQLASGLYVYRLEYEGRIRSGRAVFLK